MPPTSIALTRTFGASSGAIARVIIDSAAFAVAYAVKHGCTMLAERDEMLTIAPVAGLDHVRHDELAQQERGRDVEAQRDLERPLARLQERPGEPPARVVHEDVDAGRTRATVRVDEALELLGDGHVGRAPRARAGRVRRPSAATASMSACVRAAHTTSAPASASAGARCPRRCPCPRR